MNLTQHFTLEEMERSETALSRGIENYAKGEAVENLRNLCQEVLEPLRQWWGAPIIVNSGYRSAALNEAVGGVSCSQHLCGEAADIGPQFAYATATVVDDTLRQADPKAAKRLPKGGCMERILCLIYDYIRLNLPYDQLIMEQDSRGNRWIHVSLRRDTTRNRRQAIRMRK